MPMYRFVTLQERSLLYDRDTHGVRVAGIRLVGSAMVRLSISSEPKAHQLFPPPATLQQAAIEHKDFLVARPISG